MNSAQCTLGIWGEWGSRGTTKRPRNTTLKPVVPPVYINNFGNTCLPGKNALLKKVFQTCKPEKYQAEQDVLENIFAVVGRAFSLRVSGATKI